VEAVKGLPIRFAGTLSEADLEKALKGCDILCAPSTGGESFGVVLLEAMHCGKPVVASRIEGYRELISNSEAGVLVTKEDGAALAMGIEEAVAAEVVYERRRLAARRLAARFTWTKIGKRITTLYDNVCLPEG
jgi:phosphatidylinositol alpha-mannosyltransferase